MSYSFSLEAEDGPPLPQTLDDAIVEIKRLRRALFKANQKVGDVFEQKELMARSFEDEVNHYKKLLGLK
jgi:hypothetical protein